MSFQTIYLTLVVVSFSTFALSLGAVSIWCAMAPKGR
jgi:hypothetical protein